MVVRNARVVTAGHDYGMADIVVEGDKIAAVEKATARPVGADDIDGTGLIALPGFVDIHSHGRGGHDFCDATDEAFAAIARGKAQDGVTSFLATGLTRPEADLARLCECAARYRAAADKRLPSLLGVHLEGPFFNLSMAGAQNPDYLKKPDIAMVDRLRRLAPILKVSYAPELDEGTEPDFPFTRALVERGIVGSLGHSAADYAVFEGARVAGATHLTHFCNAMMPVHHLRPSMVTGGLTADDVYAEIITDGVHLSDPMIRLILRCKGPDRLMIITDAMCAAGEPDGIYSLGGLRVKVERGRATLADVPYDPKAVVSNVAGSVALFPQCFKRYVAATALPLSEAVKAAGFNQLRSLGIADRGELLPGQIADVVLVNAGLDPVATIVNGQLAWRG